MKLAEMPHETLTVVSVDKEALMQILKDRKPHAFACTFEMAKTFQVWLYLRAPELEGYRLKMRQIVAEEKLLGYTLTLVKGKRRVNKKGSR